MSIVTVSFEHVWLSVFRVLLWPSLFRVAGSEVLLQLSCLTLWVVSNCNLHDPAAYTFGYCRYYGVAVSRHFVHRFGKPINQQRNSGFIQFPVFQWERSTPVSGQIRSLMASKIFAAFSRQCFPIPGVGTEHSFEPFAVGVGHQEQSFAQMGRSELSSGYNIPLRVIPDFGKVSKDSSHTSIEQPWYIFQDRILWFNRFGNTVELRPQPSFIIFSPSFPGEANRLAREPATKLNLQHENRKRRNA